MKHILFALAAQFACGCLCAQTAINAGFGQATISGEYQFEFSIGEMSAVTTITAAAAGGLRQISQGFLQPQKAPNSKPRAMVAPTLSLSVVPNPATENILLQGNWADVERIRYTILTAEGRLLLEQETTGNNVSIHIGHFEPGVYFLTVVVAEKSETFRFVKH